ncbi:DUF3299 domain-containing protein [Ponticoccus sp. SC2-23]|uniref:DUF3299 domain-containing protein n=1 Tax=Alexandriicola marinus TaxID=2081710 RepID=UPI000FD8E086|nr:DUF3299 domain-containing protein [Alexandriicola marinus]MBM1219816.1 DUF3299 domain-containing protein [Ponticoccus sp. SC6-9]MBM1223112.1 DUF3299 domain-containing protein [Ponticoccus sp. SC6-15]MBM1229629.1 DUF3299 domain-containing protein [Ponticoccus sp. SC6-38]MBM1232078.1 DUF3299 domain-containing protein [Ponticoccus sp. SC6-45]MBM1237972.1 DUF3299 domain-containing protein [Ponticoccus sp. SC6-49]MBM1241089.1 DUF3299 domain-containing protein [Ponticoccus sp. SC2-64]MBM1245602
MKLGRRNLLCLAGAAMLVPGPGRAEDYIDLDWADLLPEGETAIPEALRGLIDHDDAPLVSQQPASTGVRGDWNGQIVRLPGFIVPIEYDGTGVTAFILVPYVGACVHVPPPPANQLVFVTTQTPYEAEGLFEAVNVIGMFGVSSISTQLADIGYALSADRIEPYRR